jgi:hypothetical protein
LEIFAGIAREILKISAVVAGVTTEGGRDARDFPADLFLPARSEIFSGQKFLARKFVRPDFFAAKVFPAKIFRLES